MLDRGTPHSRSYQRCVLLHNKHLTHHGPLQDLVDDLVIKTLLQLPKPGTLLVHSLHSGFLHQLEDSSKPSTPGTMLTRILSADSDSRVSTILLVIYGGNIARLITRLCHFSGQDTHASTIFVGKTRRPFSTSVHNSLVAYCYDKEMRLSTGGLLPPFLAWRIGQTGCGHTARPPLGPGGLQQSCQQMLVGSVRRLSACCTCCWHLGRLQSSGPA